MAVYKDNSNGYSGKWRVAVSYKDINGKNVKHEKRGFNTRRDAIQYEAQYKLLVNKDLGMLFGEFVNCYKKDKGSRIKPTTLKSKEFMIDKHILPYFSNRPVSSITSTDILQWQNKLLSLRDEYGKPYSDTYLRTLENQLVAIFNHAVKYYGLEQNPVYLTDRIGKKQAGEMKFWTLKEYKTFIEAVKNKPQSYYAFQVLFYTGCRLGELLGLTLQDIDFENKKMMIRNNYQLVDGKGMLLTPKTDNSTRIIDLPEFLCAEIKDYADGLYGIENNDRIFQLSKSYLHHEITRGAKIAGVKRIRIHDLRHSHAALLVSLGYSIPSIAARLGNTIQVCQRYIHLYPSIQQEIAEKLNKCFEAE